MDKNRRKLFVNILLYGVFGVYVLLLLLILFRQRHAVRSVNLIPLRSIFAFVTGRDLSAGTAARLDPGFIRGIAVSNILGNVVIFIPLGVYAALFARNKSIWKNTLPVLLASAAAEGVQFAFKLGIFDIDDIILNALGGLVGVLVCRGLYWLYKDDGGKVRCAVAVMAPVVGIISFALLVFINRQPLTY